MKTSGSVFSEGLTSEDTEDTEGLLASTVGGATVGGATDLLSSVGLAGLGGGVVEPSSGNICCVKIPHKM